MRLPFGLVSFLASIALATPAAAFCRLTTLSPSTAETASGGCVEGGTKLFWQQRCISYTIVPNERLAIDDETVRDVIEASFAAWTSVQCKEGETLPVVLGQTDMLGECTAAEYNRFGPNANTVVFVSDWAARGRDYVAEAYGLTLITHDPDSGEILDADIQINLNRGTPAVCRDQCSGPNDVDLQNVLTHEAGHFLGLAHSENTDATMYGDARLAETKKRTLEVDDVAGMCAIYGLLDKPVCTRPDFAPRRGFTPTCAEPMASHGCALRPGAAQAGALGSSALALIAVIGLARRRRPAAR